MFIGGGRLALKRAARGDAGTQGAARAPEHIS